MKQIITGPFGRVAYHSASRQSSGQYPALNLPCLKFASGAMPQAANQTNAPGVIRLPSRTRARAALAMFGTPAKREN